MNMLKNRVSDRKFLRTEPEGGVMKKKTFSGIFKYIIMACLIFGLSISYEAENVMALSTKYVTANSLLIRKKASSSGAVVGSYSKGTKVTSYGTSGGWTKIKYSGAYRYVASRYLSSTKPKTTTSIYTRYVTANSLIIRKKASSTGAKVGSYSKGTKVTCYGTSGSWTKVKYSGAYRYVSTSYLSTTKPKTTVSSSTYTRYVTASSLVIRKKASSTGTKVGSYSKGTKVTCYGTSGEWTKVKYSGAYRYVSTSYLSTTKPKTTVSSSTYTRYVTASSLVIRKKASSTGTKVGSYSKGTKVTCYGTSGEWTKVKYSGAYCYVSTSYLSTTKPSTATGSSVASYALQFVGNPYKWGGTSLTKGADCSGFTMSVFAHFGYSLPHSAVSQRYCGTAVTWAGKKVGDLICYNSINGIAHVGIYIGNNQVVHAGDASTGIHISRADYRSVNCVRRIVK